MECGWCAENPSGREIGGEIGEIGVGNRGNRCQTEYFQIPDALPVGLAAMLNTQHLDGVFVDAQEQDARRGREQRGLVQGHVPGRAENGSGQLGAEQEQKKLRSP